MTTRFIASLSAFLVLVFAWLGFAYLMRDSGILAGILGWGLFGILIAGYFLMAGADE